MKIGFAKDSMTVSFEVENDEDIVNASRIQKMTESEEWQILVMAWSNVRLKYEEAIKKVRPTEVSFRDVAIKCAAFNGFDEALSVAPKIIRASTTYRKDRLAEIEAQLQEVSNGHSSNEFEPEQ